MHTAQAQLAELLEVEPISLSRMVDRLQESAMVERRSDPQDRRAWCLYLTEKAEPVVQQMRTVSDALHQQALQGFEVNERLILESLLERIRANLLNNTTDTVERVAAHG